MQQLGRCRCAVAGLEFKSQRQQHRHLSTQHPDPPPPSPNTTNTHSHSRSVLATSRTPYHDEARSIGVQFYTDVDDFAEEHPDVVVLATSILSTEAVLRSLPLTRLKRSTLVVDVLSVKARQSGTRTLSLCWGTSRLSCQPTTGLACLTLPFHALPPNPSPAARLHAGPAMQVFPKQLLLSLLPPQLDVLCTHPMFGPDSGKGSWEGLNMMYDAVRVGRDPRRQARLELFLGFFRSQGCRCASSLGSF